MNDSIKIGTFGPFSGPLALRTSGPMMYAGAAAWLDLFNARGGWAGRPVELISKDNGYDVERTLVLARELVEEEHVLALLNANGTPHITAALPYLDSKRVPALLPFGGANDWFEPPRWGLFGLNPPFVGVGRLLGRWAAAEGRRRVVVFYPDYPPVSVLMAQVTARAFEEATQGAGSAIPVCVPLGCQDGVAMSEAIAREKPDAILVLVNWPELIAAMTELRRQGLSPPLYSWSANVTLQVAKAGGELLEGMKGYAALLSGPFGDAPAIRAYREAMGRLFPDQELDFLSLHAFGQAMVFTEALSRVRGELTAESLVEAFYELEGFETGILPPVTFRRDRHLGIGDVQPMQLTGGTWKPLGAPERLPTDATPAQAGV